ncbi:MAG: proton-translocating NADH-quinone oxidoreductase subunit L [Cytophagaceae bacterium SCN 52-12]|nr:MAG: proton-translocating NADH-quinone oxidoreductase subunit L [Cytophagaceae bacterium SCN 52-12]
MEIGLLIGIPFFAFLALLVSGRRFPGIAGFLGCVATAAGLFLSLSLLNRELLINIPWMSSGGFRLDFSMQTDSLTAIMLPLVHVVALLVQCYSISYMKGDKAINRYFAFIQLFLFSMIGIVLAGNLIIIYIFWELVGLSSYLLIGFWNHKPRTVWAAQKAFILNRVGDAAFLSGILLLIYHMGTVQFSELPGAMAELDPGTLTLIGLLLFGGCIGKSAQFPLSGWLPDAMEGPTPVSALIHAATMVAAGIFLMARIAFLLTPQAELVIAVIGLITMADGAVRACKAWDIKRVLAFSTQSQLGLMVFAIGLGAWQIALFHLVTHAFFKAGLFLSAGSVIHAITPPDGAAGSFDPQDMRTMGGLKSKLPVTFACYLLCAAALAGLPFFSGFLSKDAIFLAAVEKHAGWGMFAYIALAVAMLSAGLTAYYMSRQLWLIFGGKPRFDTDAIHPHESGLVMWLPMAVLTFLSFFFVFSLNPFDASGGWFLTYFDVVSPGHSVLIPVLSAVISLGAIVLAAGRARSASGFLSPYEVATKSSKNIFLRDYSEEKRYTVFFLSPFQLVAVISDYFDRFLVDGIVNITGKSLVGISGITRWADRVLVDGAVRLVTNAAKTTGNFFRTLQSGKIQSYYLVTFISLILLAIWLAAGM